MKSDKQIEASKTNGARSQGPVTEQGKSQSARNGIRHGLLAQTVVLSEEDEGRFLDLLAAYTDEFQPRSAAEATLVENMAAARWRQLRTWGAQKTEMDRDMANQDPSVGPPSVRALLALRGSPECVCTPELLLRYEIAFDHQFSRSLTHLLALQSRPAKRRTAPYHPDSPAGQTWKQENAPLRDEPQESLKTND